jgi:hypothetical protein
MAASPLLSFRSARDYTKLHGNDQRSLQVFLVGNGSDRLSMNLDAVGQPSPPGDSLPHGDAGYRFKNTINESASP